VEKESAGDLLNELIKKEMEHSAVIGDVVSEPVGKILVD
jgi:hypothetical protein